MRRKHGTQTNPLRSLLEGVCTGLGIGVQRERKMTCLAFSDLPSACAQGVGVTMSHTDDADDRLMNEHKGLADHMWM